MSRSIKYLLVIFITLSFIGNVHAQDSQDDDTRDESTTNGGPTGPGGGPTDPDVPIDGGISLLIAAGIGYGVKMKRSAARKGKEDDSAKNI